jgi:Fe-S cluster assembly scaffold protein SufB
VRAGADSDVTILDQHESGDVSALVLPQVEINVADAARVRYANVQLWGPRVWQLGRQSSRVGQDSSFTTTMVALGGDYARLAVESTMVGRGGTGAMRAVYFGEAPCRTTWRPTRTAICCSRAPSKVTPVPCTRA